MLRNLLEMHLEPGYEVAARRRAAQPPSRSDRIAGSSARSLVLAVIGILLAVAYLQASTQQPAAARIRATLAADIRQRAAATDRLQRAAGELRARLSAERGTALSSSAAGAQAAARLRDLEAATSLTALRGPGLVVTVADGGPGADPVTGSRPQGDPNNAGQVQDRDLASVVNGLWAGGAEAVSVNGQRLSPTSTIRSAGGAILVDFRPVSSPYEIRAIGNADRMQVAFADSPIARSFTTFVQLYGMTFSVHRAGSILLPAAPATVLRHAIPGGPRK
ncbi:MAG: DUF881 domain-containing protein [Actinomycetota bacterium]|nr:DUF881 domain-containing protein [Actinomycetota bacterium]